MGTPMGRLSKQEQECLSRALRVINGKLLKSGRLDVSFTREQVTNTYALADRLLHLYLRTPDVYSIRGSRRALAAALFHLGGILRSLDVEGKLISPNACQTRPKEVHLIPLRDLSSAAEVSTTPVHQWRRKVERALLINYKGFDFDRFYAECRSRGRRGPWYGFDSQESAVEVYSLLLEIVKAY